jgi:hypothetical protein
MLPVTAFLLAAAALAAPPAHADTIGGNPGPAHNYVCPHADGKPALDCYLDAVQHLYTMCRNVKSIEIIEFGYEKSTEGTNGAKSESCLDKQKQNIERPYRAALKDALRSKHLVEALRGLQELWLASMSGLAWRTGESDHDYKTRVARPYDEFTSRITAIRTDLTQPAADVPAKKAPRTGKTAKGGAKAGPRSSAKADQH